MVMMTNFNAPILPRNVAPIAARGGKRRRSRKYRTRRYRKSNTHAKNGRTRRHH